MSKDSVGFAALEQQISRVADELERLRGRNRELEAEVARLEGELERGAAPAEPDPQDQPWQQEREALRRRVAELVSTLEALLGTEDAGAV